MAQLTWRNVDAPDVGTSLRGLDQFSRLLNQAVDTARGTAAQIDNERSAEVNQGIALAALREQDPAAFQRRLQEGTFLSGVDPRRVSAQTISMLASRPGQLMTQALTGQQLQAATRTNEQTVANDALAADTARLYALRRAGRDDPALAASIDSRRAGIGAGNSRQITSDLETANRGYQDEQTQNLRNSIARDENARGWNQDARAAASEARTANDYNIGQRAQSMLTSILESGLDGPGVAAAIQAAPAELRYALMQGAAGAGFGNVFAPGAGAGGIGAGGGGGATDPLGTMNYQAAGAGFGSVPSNVKTLGDMSAYADRVNAAGVPSSAAGPYQITGNTRDAYAPRVFGKGWQSTDYSLENERKIAQAILRDNRTPAKLRTQWVSIKSDDEARRVLAMPEGQALDYIAQKESSSRPDQLRTSPVATATTQAGAAIRNNQDRNSPVMAAYFSNLDKAGVPSLTVAQQLSAGPLKGIPASWIQNQIDTQLDASGGRLNPSQIGAFLVQNIRQDNRNAPRLDSFFGGATRLGGNRVLNSQGFDASIKEALSARPTDTAQSIVARETAANMLPAAAQKAAAANAQYDNAVAQLRSGRRIDPAVIQRYKANADEANRAVGILNQQIAGTNNQPVRTPEQNMPASSVTPRNRWTGQPVPQAKSLLQASVEALTGLFD